MKAIGGLRGQVVALTTVVNEFAENQGAVKELAEVRVFRKVSALNNRSKKNNLAEGSIPYGNFRENLRFPFSFRNCHPAYRRLPPGRTRLATQGHPGTVALSASKSSTTTRRKR